MLVEGTDQDPKPDENGNSEVVIVSTVSAPTQSSEEVVFGGSVTLGGGGGGDQDVVQVSTPNGGSGSFILPDRSSVDSSDKSGPPQGVMTSSTSSSGVSVVYNGLSPPPSGVGMSALDYVGPGQGVGGHPPPDAPDTKEGIEELCPVCGDKVSGYHYGLLTCESCKGFFKRTVQNKKVYTCVADRSCHIDKSQRKRCPYCRFQKCLDVGMKLEAVRADRMRGGRNKFGPMYKRDRARRLQMMRQKQMVRNQCSGNGSDPCNPDQMHQGGNPCTPPFGAHSGMASPGIYGPSDSTHGSSGGGVKQELIQIPQLSSSTSSPDSSPSPLTTGTQIVASLGFNPAVGPSAGVGNIQTGVGGPGAGTEAKPCWIPSTPSPTGSHPPRSPGGPNGTLSPKGYHPVAHHPLQSGSSLIEGQLPGGAGSNSGGGGGGGGGGGSSGASKTNALLREFQMSIMDEKEWQSQLFGLLQNQSYNQCEVDIFELMCKVIDQSLFGQVDWARNSIFFKDLKVDDQMKLLQHSWSDMLILDHLHQRIHHGLPDETTLANGQKFDLLTLALLGQTSLAENLHHIAAKFQELKLDPVDYICLKFMLLLNPEVRGLSNAKLVAEAHEQAQQTLLEYTISCYPQVNDKFNQLLQVLPEIHLIGMRGEEFLYFRHLSGGAPTQTLLMEMLHAKKK